MIRNRGYSWDLRSAEAVPGLLDEAHNRAATASTRSKSGLELDPTIPSRTWLLRACLVHGGSGYLTSWLTRASGRADGRWDWVVLPGTGWLRSPGTGYLKLS